VRTWGEFKTDKSLKHHHELLYMVDGFDLPRGVGVAGHRAYFLKGVGVQLNLALITYGLDFLRKRNYTSLQTPFFMNKDVMAKTAQLETFNEDLYKVQVRLTTSLPVRLSVVQRTKRMRSS
jgi:seryl-tRNA synthetase